MLAEEKLWQKRMGLEADVHLCNAVNAFAKPNGDVYLGQPLVNQLMARSGPAFAFQAIGFIMAHEYSHQFQFLMLGKRGQPVESGPKLELQADLLGGYWVGMRLKEQQHSSLFGEIEAVAAIARKMAYDLGDFAVNSPQHHGTPQQRYAAVAAGLTAGFASKFGAPDKAFKDNADQIFDWSAEQVDGILKGQ